MIPRRDPHATPEQEASRLRAIVERTAYSHGPDYERVRRLGDGAGGHKHGNAIYPDDNPRLECFAYWRSWTKADQEDFGYPPAGWFTGLGIWETVA